MTKLLLIIYAVIAGSVLLYFGIDNKTAWYFDRPGNDKDNDFVGDYLYQTNRFGDNPRTFSNGLMVGHYANIAVVTISLCLIATILYYGSKPYLTAICHCLYRFDRSNSDSRGQV